MNTKYKILLLIILLTPQAFQAQECPIFPHPTNYQSAEGEFVLGDMLAVSRINLPQSIKDDLKWYLTHDLKVNAVFVNDGGQMVFNRMVNAPQDAYSILVDDKINITYTSEASLFYAVTSLKQMVQETGGLKVIHNCLVSDEPHFQWRGMHLDVSRHFYTVEEVKTYLDLMARYKFNRFHWHLTDDQGWRIEIKQYPKLAEIGGERAQTLIGHASNDPEKFDGILHKGFYTQKEIKEIVKYAAKLHIEVVPEIEMPGHARAALAAYPEYSCDGKAFPVAEKWGVFDEIFCSKTETIDFLQNILSEVVELFPSEYIHIGGDEAPKTSWKKCERCQDVIAKNNLASEAELQSYFIKQMDAFLTSKGKRLLGWDEILEGGLSPNAAVMSWRGTKGGIEAAEQDHMVVMTPGSHCYFDHYQSDRDAEPLAFGGFTPLEKVYAFSPIPGELSSDKHGMILGGQANVWTEYIPDFNHVQYMILPRMIALSEVLWGTKTDYTAFLSRLKNIEFPRLDKMNMTYSSAAFYMNSTIETTEEGIKVTFSSSDTENQIIGSDPVNKGVERISETEFLFKPTAKLTKSSASASIMSGMTVDNLEIEIWQHSTLGKEWKLSESPSDFYSGNGGFTLSDGIRGGRPWNGKEWLGFDNGSVELEMNFENKKLVNSVTVSNLKASSSWIYLPESITLKYSKNGKRWKEKTVEVHNELTEITLGKKAKFLKVEVKAMDIIPAGQTGEGHTPWLFLDEIWIEL